MFVSNISRVDAGGDASGRKASQVSKGEGSVRTIEPKIELSDIKESNHRQFLKSLLLSPSKCLTPRHPAGVSETGEVTHGERKHPVSYCDGGSASTIAGKPYLHCYVPHTEAENKYSRFYFNDRELFQKALELSNRIGCVYSEPSTKTGKSAKWTSQEPYFECKGYMMTSVRMCVRCRDTNKGTSTKDLYYIDMGEIASVRTVYCHGCLGYILQHSIGTEEDVITAKLEEMRIIQEDGIFVQQRLVRDQRQRINHVHT